VRVLLGWFDGFYEGALLTARAAFARIEPGSQGSRDKLTRKRQLLHLCRSQIGRDADCDATPKEDAVGATCTEIDAGVPGACNSLGPKDRRRYPSMVGRAAGSLLRTRKSHVQAVPRN
jgi:hypothetical protein